MAVRADIGLQELFNPFHALFVLHVGQGILHGVFGVKVREIHLTGGARGLVLVNHVPFDGRPVEHDIPFLRRQVFERHIGPDAHFAGDILHEGPHERLPGQHSALVDGQGFVGHQGRLVDGPDQSRAAAGFAGAAAVESQVFGTGPVKLRAAHGAGDLLHGRHMQGRFHIVAVRAAVARQARKHKAQAVQQFRRRAERAAYARYAGALVQGQGCRHVAHVVHLGLLGLGHTAARIGGKGLQVAAGPFRIEHAQGQGRFARPGYAGNGRNRVERYIDVDSLQVMHPGTAHFDAGRLYPFLCLHKQYSPYTH